MTCRELTFGFMEAWGISAPILPACGPSRRGWITRGSDAEALSVSNYGRARRPTLEALA